MRLTVTEWCENEKSKGVKEGNNHSFMEEKFFEGCRPEGWDAPAVQKPGEVPQGRAFYAHPPPLLTTVMGWTLAQDQLCSNLNNSSHVFIISTEAKGKSTMVKLSHK